MAVYIKKTQKQNMNSTYLSKNKRGGEIPIEFRERYKDLIKERFIDPYKGVSLAKLNRLGKKQLVPGLVDSIQLGIKTLENTRKIDDLGILQGGPNISDYRDLLKSVLSQYNITGFNVDDEFTKNFFFRLKESKDDYEDALNYAIDMATKKNTQTQILNEIQNIDNNSNRFDIFIKQLSDEGITDKKQIDNLILDKIEEELPDNTSFTIDPKIGADRFEELIKEIQDKGITDKKLIDKMIKKEIKNQKKMIEINIKTEVKEKESTWADYLQEGVKVVTALGTVAYLIYKGYKAWVGEVDDELEKKDGKEEDYDSYRKPISEDEVRQEYFEGEERPTLFNWLKNKINPKRSINDEDDLDNTVLEEEGFSNYDEDQLQKNYYERFPDEKPQSSDSFFNVHKPQPEPKQSFTEWIYKQTYGEPMPKGDRIRLFSRTDGDDFEKGLLDQISDNIANRYNGLGEHAMNTFVDNFNALSDYTMDSRPVHYLADYLEEKELNKLPKTVKDEKESWASFHQRRSMENAERLNKKEEENYIPAYDERNKEYYERYAIERADLDAKRRLKDMQKIENKVEKKSDSPLYKKVFNYFGVDPSNTFKQIAKQNNENIKTEYMKERNKSKKDKNEIINIPKEIEESKEYKSESLLYKKLLDYFMGDSDTTFNKIINETNKNLEKEYSKRPKTPKEINTEYQNRVKAFKQSKKAIAKDLKLDFPEVKESKINKIIEEEVKIVKEIVNKKPFTMQRENLEVLRDLRDSEKDIANTIKILKHEISKDTIQKSNNIKQKKPTHHLTEKILRAKALVEETTEDLKKIQQQIKELI